MTLQPHNPGAVGVKSALRCGYHEGMFNHASGWTAAPVHEAGHAVVAYASGLGFIEIAVSGHDGGKVTGTKRSTDRLHKVVERVVSRSATDFEFRFLASLGAYNAAGMAAERKFAFACGLPLAPQGAVAGGSVSDEDHRTISIIDGLLSRYSAIKPFCFSRFVWSAAQRVMESDCIWRATEAIAQFIEVAGASFCDDPLVMSGQAARRLMRQSGVVAGSLRIEQFKASDDE